MAFADDPSPEEQATLNSRHTSGIPGTLHPLVARLRDEDVGPEARAMHCGSSASSTSICWCRSRSTAWSRCTLMIRGLRINHDAWFAAKDRSQIEPAASAPRNMLVWTDA